MCTDSKYVADTLAKTEKAALRAGAPHLDLWKLIWIGRSNIKEIRWIKSHLSKEEAQQLGWDCELWQGNLEADKLATAGVGLHWEEEGVVRDFHAKKLLIGSIQRHLLKRFQVEASSRGTYWGAEHRAPCRKQGTHYLASFRQKQGPTRAEKWEEYLRKHDLVIKGKWETCRRCQKRTGFPGKRVNRLMQWRPDCVPKQVKDAQGHTVVREPGGARCLVCGRLGRKLKQVKCGSAHRGRLASGLGTPSIRDFWGTGKKRHPWMG